MTELLDRRVLGAVRFQDAATNTRIVEGLVVESPQADLRKNRSGLWVLWNVAGLEAHTLAFDSPPAAPPLSSVSVELTVSDASGRYVARKAAIRLPRDPDITHADQAGSLFQPIDITLYPAPNAPVSAGWAVIRAHVRNNATNAPLRGAVLRVVRVSDGQIVARGMSDERGEALVVVPGIPITTFNVGNGPPLAAEIDVNVEAIFDPGAGVVPDPDQVEAESGLPSVSAPHKLAAGRELSTEFAVAIP
jgi:hypothetical protein